MNNLVAVFIGGGAGSLARYGVSMLVVKLAPKAIFPLATLVSNVASCLIFSLVLLFVSEKASVSFPLRLLLLTGFCGGFSTFSAFSYETAELLRSGNITYAAANILLSLICCFAVIWFIYPKQ